MRTVKAMAGNGQAINEVVTYNSLTAQEKEMLIIPANNKVSDYANFQVRHNKKGELLGVKPHDFTSETSEQIQKQANTPNILDVYTAFGKSTTPVDRKGAKAKLKRAGVYDKAKKAMDNNLI